LKGLQDDAAEGGGGGRVEGPVDAADVERLFGSGCLAAVGSRRLPSTYACVSDLTDASLIRRIPSCNPLTLLVTAVTRALENADCSPPRVSPDPIA